MARALAPEALRNWRYLLIASWRTDLLLNASVFCSSCATSSISPKSSVNVSGAQFPGLKFLTRTSKLKINVQFSGSKQGLTKLLTKAPQTSHCIPSPLLDSHDSLLYLCCFREDKPYSLLFVSTKLDSLTREHWNWICFEVSRIESKSKKSISLCQRCRPGRWESTVSFPSEAKGRLVRS